MPGYGLAPVDKVIATYHSRELTLKATGKVPAFLYGFHFDREMILGGLKFSFNAWSEYPFMGDQELNYSQTFLIPNIQAFDPEMTVTIVDLNHTKGQVIPIEAQTNGATAGQSQALTDNNAAGALVARTIFPDPIPRTVLYKEPFTINRSTDGSRNVDIKHDDSSLILETAGFDSGNLYWTFNSLQTGTTEVIVSVTSDFVIHDVPIITKYIYVITVIYPLNILPVPPPEEILSFRGRVLIAQRIVEEKYKDVHLLDVFVKLPYGVPYPVKDPLRLSHMRCLFLVENGLVTISSNGWETFGPPVFSEDVQVGLRTFKIEDVIDITAAAKEMVKAGIDLSFFHCDLSDMLVSPAEQDDQPYYVFFMENDSYTFVGAKDGSVRNVPARLKVLPGKAEVKKIENGA